MRRVLISLGVAVPLALAPFAVAGPGGDPDRPAEPELEHPDRHGGDADGDRSGRRGGPESEGPERHRSGGPESEGAEGEDDLGEETHYILKAIVSEDADAETVEVDVLGGNGAMREALEGETDLTVALDEDTVVRLKGRGMRSGRDGGEARARTGKKGGKSEDSRRRRGGKRHVGTSADLAAGDLVTVRFRAEAGTLADDLPAARLVVDHGTPKPVTYRLRGVLAGDATEDGAEITVGSANRHMRRALDDATTFTATFGERTRIRLAGTARPEDGRKRGTYADLSAGDRVVVKLRAPLGSDLAGLPAVHRLVDLGPAPADEEPSED